MGEMTVAEVLNRAADLIEPEGAWTQGWHALDALGSEAETAEAAVCFCALGAISVAYGCNPGDELGYDAQEVLCGLIDDSIVHWNDAPERTQAEVVAALRRAATLAAIPTPSEGTPA